MAKLLCLLAILVSRALAQSVEGSVFDAATGAGIAGVKVELLKGATPFYETATDGGGRFRIENVREGEYAARYQASDYWLTAGPSDYKVFPVTTAASPVKLEARLMPWSRISGRVVDHRGNGVPNARLELTGSGMLANGRTYLRTSWGGGGGGVLNEFPLGMTFMGNTDARGNFQVQLMPGAYGLSVLPPADLKPPEPEEGGPALAWVRTYYPGVALAESSAKIVVLPGGDASDVELKLLAVPAHAVRGVLLNPDGTPAAKVTIKAGEPMRPSSAESKSDGAFEFPALPEGECAFLAEAQNGDVKVRAAEWIEIPKHDLENVKLRLVPPLTLHGRVRMEAPKDGPAPPRPGPLIFSLRGGRNRRDSDFGLAGAALATPDAEGDFAVRDAYPGVYRFGPQLQPSPPPYYLDAIRLGDKDLSEQDVEISSDIAVSVIYKADGGTLRGTAENCHAGGVLLIPANPALRRPGFSRSGACDAAGHYEVQAVRPGDYYALAFAGDGPVLTPDDALLNQAVKVTVRSGEATSADLRAVTRPIY
jgi:hypothetical protein